MAKAKSFIQPVKYVQGQGWVVCEPHQARMWEARIGARIIGRYPAKWEATEVLEADLKRKVGLLRYNLGTRMKQRPEGSDTYAKSLTQAEYNQLKNK
jgi:hypothetical protein